ncbi:MAG: 50S ribosomal protein L13 [Methanomassiliicoccales archaeon]|nr:50S ribosomal protein L13 [Methanomassiliicoccales archaeon]NYT14703.1 50S ribosomal protein L13 [Methanomassiliicoccales archaeon]
MVVIDADGHVLGRLSSDVAQRIMNGEDVIIVNADKALITGGRATTLSDYKQKKDRGKIRKGPFYPRRADLIFKRTVRGMIPFDKSRGREAYRRLKVFVGVPREYESAKVERIEKAMQVNTSRYITLGEVSAFLGSNVR